MVLILRFVFDNHTADKSMVSCSTVIHFNAVVMSNVHRLYCLNNVPMLYRENAIYVTLTSHIPGISPNKSMFKTQF